MNIKKRIISHMILLVIGVAAFAASVLGYLDEFGLGFGVVLVVIEVFRLIQDIRVMKDASYAKKAEIQNSDERTIYISNKAKAWTVYLSVLILAILCIFFHFIGQDILMQFCGFTVSGMMLIYWIVYLILSKKY